MLIHAYRRKEAFTVDLNDIVIEFAPNKAGEVVAEVDADAHCETLLTITEAYAAHGAAAAPKVANKVVTEPAKSAFVLIDGDKSLDLATMNEAALKEFAKANGVNPHHTWTGKNLDKLRQKLVDHFKAE